MSIIVPDAPQSLPPDFDPELYLAFHKDVAASGMAAADHYLRFGRGEGRAYRRSEMQMRYDSDGLVSSHNHDFMQDPVFRRAYQRGVKAAGADYGWYWRVHVGLWAASCAIRLKGDFVECGVNRGFLSSAIMDLLDWNRLGRTFYLLDTFSGLDPRFVSKEELKKGAMKKNEAAIASGFYTTNLREVQANFAEWGKHVQLVVGSIPETLDRITSPEIAFAHIDLNCAPPEVAALEYLWPRLVTGAYVLLDDYAFKGYESQKHAMDAFAAANNVSILSLPTGQGLIVRPPREGAAR